MDVYGLHLNVIFSKTIIIHGLGGYICCSGITVPEMLISLIKLTEMLLRFGFMHKFVRPLNMRPGLCLVYHMKPVIF